MENWRSIFGYEGLYEVSDLGKVRSIDRVVVSSAGWSAFKKGTILKPIDNRNGYKYVSLWKNGRVRREYIHRLVATTFLGDPPSPEYQVAHGDGIKDNNALLNLRWATPRENASDRVLHGTDRTGVQKDSCKRGHLLCDPNVNVYGSENKRSCRACSLMLSYLSKRDKPDEAVMADISDEYYKMIMAGDKVFYQPLCHRGHLIAGANRGLYKKHNKKYCRACEYARKSPRGRQMNESERKVYSDEIFQTRYGGGA